MNSVRWRKICAGKFSASFPSDCPTTSSIRTRFATHDWCGRVRNWRSRIDNARTARQVVWELFQDLEGFRLDEYKQMDDGGEGMARLMRYFQAALARKGAKCIRISDTRISGAEDGEPAFRITTDREAAKEDENYLCLGWNTPS